MDEPYPLDHLFHVRLEVCHNAWQLIDGIGYRGKQIGGAMVSDKHCNFILNVHKATALEYLTLIEEIQREVKNKYDIDLKMEVEKFNWK